MQPLKLYTASYPAPNPVKVLIVLNELSLPFEFVLVQWGQLKTRPYEDTNPNGRLPALVDPNRGGLTIWESGAIVEYLVEKYDPGHLLHHDASSGSDADLQVRYAEKQFLHFQMSGQGPYFGQAVWFVNFHPEDVESAKDRYRNEIDRVTAVLDGLLKDTPYLTGPRVSYADLAFVPWYFTLVHRIDPEMVQKLSTKYARFGAWFKTLSEREAVKKSVAIFRDPTTMPHAVDLDGKAVAPAEIQAQIDAIAAASKNRTK